MNNESNMAVIVVSVWGVLVILEHYLAVCLNFNVCLCCLTFILLAALIGLSLNQSSPLKNGNESTASEKVNFSQASPEEVQGDWKVKLEPLIFSIFWWFWDLKTNTGQWDMLDFHFWVTKLKSEIFPFSELWAEIS